MFKMGSKNEEGEFNHVGSVQYIQVYNAFKGAIYTVGNKHSLVVQGLHLTLVKH